MRIHMQILIQTLTPGCLLGPPCGPSGASWVLLGGSWVSLVASWVFPGLLGDSWVSPGCVCTYTHTETHADPDAHADTYPNTVA